MFIRPLEDWIAILIVTIGATVLLASCEQEPAHAGYSYSRKEYITNDRAVSAILGEARGEGYAGMYAVACAIRNRGHLRGVYGAGYDYHRERPEVWQKALNAWENSATGPDVTHGAADWESVDFKRPYWAKNMVQTVRIGKHIFYREK